MTGETLYAHGIISVGYVKSLSHRGSWPHLFGKPWVHHSICTEADKLLRHSARGMQAAWAGLGDKRWLLMPASKAFLQSAVQETPRESLLLSKVGLNGRLHSNRHLQDRHFRLVLALDVCRQAQKVYLQH